MFRIKALSSIVLALAITAGTAHSRAPDSADTTELDILSIQEEILRRLNGPNSINAQISVDSTGPRDIVSRPTDGFRSEPKNGTNHSAARISNLPGQTTRRRGTQLQGRPLPECRSFWITEVGYFRRFTCPTKIYRKDYGHGGYTWTDTRMYTPVKHNFTWELGRMTNNSLRSALGASVFISTGTDGLVRFGVKPRYRRWLDKKTSLDIAPGILVKGTDPLEKEFPGYITYMGLNFEDIVSVYAQMEVHRLEKFGTDVAWFGGVKLGSYPGLIVGAGGALVYGLVKIISSIDLDMGMDWGASSFGGCGG